MFLALIFLGITAALRNSEIANDEKRKVDQNTCSEQITSVTIKAENAV